MKATETTILKFIGGEDKVFIIPPFQRNYEWSTEQCEELFEDILNAAKNKKSHYLGNVIYYEGDNSGASFNENILIDGQQRVTTILLLLCAIKDLSSDEILCRKIERKYLKNEDEDNSYRVRLKQTDYDQGSFERVVNGTLTPDEKGKIAENYRKFKELIKESDVDPKVLFEVIPKLEIVEVNLQIDALETVQTIFEKINSTGKPLSAADLLRNYLLITNNTKEQERLYKNYWVKIEEAITTEHISEFVNDYLIMKTCEPIEKTEIYKDFKNYVQSSSYTHEDILKDMLDYSKYYQIILTNDSGDKKLDREIKFLKFLGATDMYSLFMYLLKRCREENEDVIKIFNLLRCFLTRFRIVGAYEGGGTLSSIVSSLIKNMELHEIDCSFDAIQFELSNSASINGRYPDDEEFKASLMTSKKQNYRYARAIFLAIEEFETKNIPIDFDKVTIEHLMPQTLSDWWTRNLGGKDKAEITYNTYLHCIGNLAPLSGSYNSKNSNKPWTSKIKIIKDVQFKTTKEILDKDTWNEESIVERNKNIADRACKAILAPLPRKRPCTNQKAFDDFVPGIYLISDNINISGSDIKSLTIDGNTFIIENWNQLLVKACEYVLNIDPQKFSDIVKSNLIHKDKRSKNPSEYDPILTVNKNYLITAKKIASSQYYAEGTLSSTRARFFTNLLLQQYGIADLCSITVDKKS